MSSRFSKNFLSVIMAAGLAACSGGDEPIKTAPPVQSVDLKGRPNTCLPERLAPVNIPAGEAIIGSDDAYPEEGPARTISVAAFSMDATEVTNAQFAAFVAATGYVTDAEKKQAGFGTPGAAVFLPPTATRPSWWHFVKNAQWRYPEGQGSDIIGRGDDPVVQVSFNDAFIYATWAGRRLPTEAEWEYAAKGGADTRFVWGEERAPNGEEKANTWQGAFPLKNELTDGHALRAPAGCYEPNGYGLYDMIGNVWEWTATPFQESQEGEPLFTLKGGSFLCAENYCKRYRASARQPQEAGFSTSHIGFRTVGPPL